MVVKFIENLGEMLKKGVGIEDLNVENKTILDFT
jgi:hypothetical protein